MCISLKKINWQFFLPSVEKCMNCDKKKKERERGRERKMCFRAPNFSLAMLCNLLINPYHATKNSKRWVQTFHFILLPVGN